jgi:UDP-3-O-[3-hydroxymyristoyl] glucosamine N-acyltransferase
LRLDSPLTLDELARAAGAELRGDGATPVAGIASLEKARADELGFVRSPELRERALGSRAGALLVPEDFGPADRPLLVAAGVDAALARLAAVFLDRACPSPPPGVHETAFVGSDVAIGEDASVGPLAVIEDGVRIGPRARIAPGSFVGRGAEIGADTVIHANASVCWGCRVGRRCVVHPGAVIGADGFGFARGPDGSYRKVPQMGNVVVGDDVELGACACIDRATVDSTVIGNGVKLDNLVHVAHNCAIGERTAFAAQVGIAGSVGIGRDCELGGQTGVSGHLTMGDRVRAGGASRVTKDLPEGAEVWGYPARDKRKALREMASLSRLPGLLEEVRSLRGRLEALERAARPRSKKKASRSEKTPRPRKAPPGKSSRGNSSGRSGRSGG